MKLSVRSAILTVRHSEDGFLATLDVIKSSHSDWLQLKKKFLAVLTMLLEHSTRENKCTDCFFTKLYTEILQLAPGNAFISNQQLPN